MIALALCVVAAAMLLVRLGWGGVRGAAPVGWALATAALVALAAGDGAWGLAMGMVVAIAVALGMIVHAGWTAPARARRPVREAASVTLPHQPAELARRFLVFVLVVPVAFAAAQWFAFGAQALARRGGTGEADAIVLMLFLQPILWGGLMAWQMTQASPGRMIVPPVGAALAGTMLWSLA